MNSGREAFRFLIVGLLLTAAAWWGVVGCAAATTPAPSAARAAAIPTHDQAAIAPLRFVRGVPVVQVHIDGQGPFDMVLDTGAMLCVVSPRLIERLDGTDASDLARARGQVSDVHGRTVDIAHELRGRRWSIGQADLPSFRAAVLPIENVRLALGEAIEGILGMPAFAGRTFSIDYAGRRLGIGWEMPGDVPAAHVLEADLDRHGLRVPVRWRHETLSFALDTASTLGVEIKRQEIWRMAFTAPPQTTRGAQGLTGGGEDELIGRLYDDMHLADVTLRRPIVRSGSDNRIGAALLSQFTLHVDTRRRRVALEPRDGHEVLTFAPVRRVWPTFEVRPTGEGLEVVAVQDQARTGADDPPLRRGDVIVRAAGRPVQRYDPTTWASLLTGDRPVPLVVRRDGSLRGIVLPVRDVVP